MEPRSRNQPIFSGYLSIAKLAGEVTGMMGIMVIYYNFSRYL